ncbi:ORF6N domain-containing protein [Clostridium baratii]|uniref:ORF6N domain-containing protein n=1 Tax=Clostridium baratii TaxID=1561 RepID=UPI0030CED718
MSNLVKINNNDLQAKEFKGQRVITFKEIDLVHERVEGTANKRFLDNQKHFIEDVDYFELTGDVLKEIKRLPNFGIGLNASKAILITESGYLMLVKSLSDDLAWTVQRELVNKYFRVKEDKPTCIEDVLINSLQEMKVVKQKLKEANNNALEAKAKAEETKEEVQAIRDVVAINTTNWREDCRRLIVKIAHELGGNGYIRDVNNEVYSLMRARLNCRLDVKRTNMRRRMADEGVCKSKRDKVTYLDVIETDNRLKEGYIAIVKELAIKYGAA